MDISFPIPAHLRFDLPSQRAPLTPCFLCSCLKVCSSSDRFLPINLSIRYFSISQRYKSIKERANYTLLGQHSWKIKEPLNNVKCQRLCFFLGRHFQWSKCEVMKNRVPKTWSALKRNFHVFGLIAAFRRSLGSPSFFGCIGPYSSKPSLCKRHYAGWHFTEKLRESSSPVCLVPLFNAISCALPWCEGFIFQSAE